MNEDRFTLLRLAEAILFATAEPVAPAALAQRLPEGTDVKGLVEELKGLYANRGVHLVEMEGRYAFRTAPDLGPRLQIEREELALAEVALGENLFLQVFARLAAFLAGI